MTQTEALQEARQRWGEGAFALDDNFGDRRVFSVGLKFDPDEPPIFNALGTSYEDAFNKAEIEKARKVGAAARLRSDARKVVEEQTAILERFGVPSK